MSVSRIHDPSLRGTKTIVLLHGITNTAGSWERLLATRVGRRLDVIAPDIRGHGRAAHVRPVSLGPVLDDIVEVMPTSPAAQVTLLGYSQGARIALHAALDPDIAPRVEHLVLIGGSPGLADPEERAARWRADEHLADELEAMSIEQFAAHWAQTPVLSGIDPQIARESAADRLNNTAAGLAAALRGLGTGALPSLWDRLVELPMRVTLIAGERDEKFTGLAYQMAEHIPQVRVAIVPGAGHQVHLEQPEHVASLL